MVQVYCIRTRMVPLLLQLGAALPCFTCCGVRLKVRPLMSVGTRLMLPAGTAMKLGLLLVRPWSSSCSVWAAALCTATPALAWQVDDYWNMKCALRVSGRDTQCSTSLVGLVVSSYASYHGECVLPEVPNPPDGFIHNTVSQCGFTVGIMCDARMHQTSSHQRLACKISTQPTVIHV